MMKQKNYPPIGNIGLNYEHWVSKGEDAFVSYFTEKDDRGQLKRKTYESLFARRNDAQRVELLKQHFAIMQGALNIEPVKPDTTETSKGVNKDKGVK